MRTQQLWRAAVFLLALTVLAIPALPASAQSSGNIGGRVLNPDPINPRSKSIFIYTLERGQKKQDQLLVINPTDKEQVISLLSVDGVAANLGDFTCRQNSEPAIDSGSWVQLAESQITIPAGGERAVDFTVTVPAQADVGEHNSCLVIQAASDEGEEVSAGVRLRTRQAIRMVVTIPGDLKRELSITNFNILHDSTRQKQSVFGLFDINQIVALQRYTLIAENRGNVSADTDMRVRVTSILGKEVANIGGEYPIISGESLTKEFITELRPLFGGWYKATPSIRYDKRLGVFGTETDAAEYETITGEQMTMFLWPTQLGWVIIGTVLALLLIIGRRTSGHVKRFRELKNKSQKYTVKKADTIQSLAKKSKITWQELAELNDITAPYSLEVGQRILLPKVKTVRKRRRTTKKKA